MEEISKYLPREIWKLPQILPYPKILLQKLLKFPDLLEW